MRSRAAGDSPDIGPLETHISVDGGRLFVRAVGVGPPIVVVRELIGRKGPWPSS